MNSIAKSTNVLAGLAVFWLLSTASALGDSNPHEFTVNGKPLPEVIAQVNGVDIKSTPIKTELSFLRSMWKQQGRTVSGEEQEQKAQQILSREVDNELLYQKGKAAKISIPTATVEKELDKIREKFPSEKLFLSALSLQHLTLDKLKKNIDKQLVQEEFLRKEIASDIKLEPDAAKKFYEEHQDQFLEPESYQARHIFISLPSPKEGKVPSEKARKRASQLLDLIKAEAKGVADEVEKKIKAGEDFAKLAREYTEDHRTRDQGGYLENIRKDNTLPEVFKALKALKPGETSPVIQTDFGYHFIKLEKKIDAKPVPFSEVETDIMNLLLKQETEQARKEYLDKLKKTASIKLFL